MGVSGIGTKVANDVQLEGTRTLNLRIDSPMLSLVTPCKQRTGENDLTLTGQTQPDIVVKDASLISIIENWPQLSDELKGAILRIIG